MSRNDAFRGPVFIVGMPRSGTKLLRELLNNHSRIAIAGNESHCIPYFYRRVDTYGDFRKRDNFHRFFEDFSGTIFYERLTAREPFIDENRWYAAVKQWDYAGVIEAFYRCYADARQKPIWGDKTPSYLSKVPILKELFPAAKFVHIARDVRDYCLSINKAWNLNMYRAAQRWRDTIVKFQRDAQACAPGDFIEVRYEQLSDDPEETLGRICRFLGLSFETQMLTLNRETENLGDTRGAVEIVPNNYGKWRTRLPQGKLQKIERIGGDLLDKLGYAVTVNGGPLHLSPAQMKLYRLLDGWNLLRFEIRTNGWRQGTHNFVRSTMK